MKDPYYSCEEGCGETTAINCPKMDECFASSPDILKDLQRKREFVKNGWLPQPGGGYVYPTFFNKIKTTIRKLLH